MPSANRWMQRREPGRALHPLRLDPRQPRRDRPAPGRTRGHGGRRGRRSASSSASCSPSSRSAFPRTYGPILAVTGTLYAVPSLALFVLLIPFTGLSPRDRDRGPRALHPAHPGAEHRDRLEGVPADVTEAATGMGYTPSQRFWRVELPIAMPVIVAGLRIATVTTIGLVAITTFIGLGGLGYLIVNSGYPTLLPDLDLRRRLPVHRARRHCRLRPPMAPAPPDAVGRGLAAAEDGALRGRHRVAVRSGELDRSTKRHLPAPLGARLPLGRRARRGRRDRAAGSASSSGTPGAAPAWSSPSPTSGGRFRRSGWLGIVFAITAGLFGRGGIGFLPAVIALILLAIPPIVTNTYAGMREVDRELVEAGRGMGMRERRSSALVEVPVALPVDPGRRASRPVQVVATATLATIVGGGTLGAFIIQGIERARARPGGGRGNAGRAPRDLHRAGIRIASARGSVARAQGSGDPGGRRDATEMPLPGGQLNPCVSVARRACRGLLLDLAVRHFDVAPGDTCTHSEGEPNADAPHACPRGGGAGAA